MDVIERNPFFSGLKLASLPRVDVRTKGLATNPKASPTESSKEQGIIFRAVTISILGVGAVIEAANSAEDLKCDPDLHRFEKHFLPIELSGWRGQARLS